MQCINMTVVPNLLDFPPLHLVHQIVAVVLLYTLCRKVVHCVSALPEIHVIVMPDIRQGQDTRAGENCPALGRDIQILHLNIEPNKTG